MLKPVYLSLGSNLGDRRRHLQLCLSHLAELGEVSSVSPLYQTAPVENTHQPVFFNCCVRLETRLMPRQLIASILAIERRMGRHRLQPKGPRTIDVDILLYGRAVVSLPRLTIPHPALHQRAFVLYPLVDIAPDVRHPLLQRTMRELRDTLSPAAGAVRKLQPPLS